MFKGDVVGVYCCCGYDLVVVCFGILKVGGIYLLFDFVFLVDCIVIYVEDSRVKFILF